MLVDDWFSVPLIVEVLRDSNVVEGFSWSQWDTLVRQAKAAGLLARIGKKLIAKGLDTVVPVKVWRHFESEIAVADAVKRGTLWEVKCIVDALAQLGVKALFLKGAAYTVAGVLAGNGRLYSDTDILVPKNRLDDVERMLMWNGWLDGKQNNYDQKYYRQWMHELPPKYHSHRGSVLDVHHNILPISSALSPDADLLIKDAINIADSDYWVLAPVDMVLHSASHLFWDGEFENALRDLTDLDLLLREFSNKNVNFWIELLNRADRLGLGKPLFYALRYLKHFLRTPIPKEIIHFSDIYGPGVFKTRLMDFLFMQAIKPHHLSCQTYLTAFACWLLYIRSHYLRMPWYLLIPHLTRKAWMRLTDKEQH